MAIIRRERRFMEHAIAPTIVPFTVARMYRKKNGNPPVEKRDDPPSIGDRKEVDCKLEGKHSTMEGKSERDQKRGRVWNHVILDLDYLKQ